MLILVPPSEGKTAPRSGKPLDLNSLSTPEYISARENVLEALIDLCSGDPENAVAVLGLTPGLRDEVIRNQGLRTAPTAPASRVYTGVLHAAMDIPSLSGAELRRANSWVRVASGLWGLVSPADRIPAYRLSGDVALPGIGGLQAFWREQAGFEAPPGAIIDLRSGTYMTMWHVPEARRRDTAVVRVLKETVTGGVVKRATVSHFNKETKGHIARTLIQHGSSGMRLAKVWECLRDNGFEVETAIASTGLTQADVILR